MNEIEFWFDGQAYPPVLRISTHMTRQAVKKTVSLLKMKPVSDLSISWINSQEADSAVSSVSAH